MHFNVLVTFSLPPVEENPIENAKRLQVFVELMKRKFLSPDTIVFDFYVGKLRARLTEFSRTALDAIEEIMEPYAENTDDPELLEFYDLTDELKAEYDRSVDCLLLPGGKLIEFYRYSDKYSIHDGKVYQKKAGPLKQDKRTKKAKKMKVLQDVPRSKIYETFQDYTEDQGYNFDETHQAYGYYCNPYVMWDWYEIGGRWPRMFLVRKNCKEYSVGEGTLYDTDLSAPEGYMWAAVARKKDIAWDVMRKWETQQSIHYFYRLEKMFQAGKLEPETFGVLTEDGIVGYKEYLYRKDETLNEFLGRVGIPPEWKYPFTVHDIVDEDNWDASGDYQSAEWHIRLDQYLDKLDDDTVLAGVDCHI